MSKILEAKFIDGYISIEDYNDKKHYQKIYCPECHKAPIHIVRKQDVKPYFASNRKEEHLENCQHYEEFIENGSLTMLIESNKPEDKKRLEFLIESNLNKSLRLLLNNHESFSENSKTQTLINVKKQTKIENLNICRNESILRVNIVNIRKRTECINNHIVIYGRAYLHVKTNKYKDELTNEDYEIKQLIFKTENKHVFSIFLSRMQTIHFGTDTGIFSVTFAVFGELLQNNIFLNLKITTTRNLITINE